MSQLFRWVILPIILVAGAILGASYAPEPLNYWLGLSAMLLGPGVGASHLLFPARSLSPPERLFINVMVSMCIVTYVLAMLNMLHIRLSFITISTTILTITCISAASGYARTKGRVATHQQVGHWLAFFCGVALVVLGGSLMMAIF